MDVRLLPVKREETPTLTGDRDDDLRLLPQDRRESLTLANDSRCFPHDSLCMRDYAHKRMSAATGKRDPAIF